MTAPSVGLFTYSTVPRGSVVHTAHLADALHDAGWDVTVYAHDKDGGGFFRPLRARLRLMPAAATPASTSELVRCRAAELADYVAGSGVTHDVYHAEDCLTASGLLELRRRGHPVSFVRTVHHVERFADPCLAACQERSIREAALCLAVSEAAERDILATFGVRGLRVTNGVSIDRFRRVEPARLAALREKLDVAAGGGPVLLAVGGVEERKNTTRTLRAFVRVRQAEPDARLWILGGATVLDHGAYRADFASQLAALPATTRDAVTELGVAAEEDVPAIFALASALVFPSLHEGFGLAPLEALAAGLPVVASDRSPLTEFLDRRCAVLVDPLSEESIAAGVLAALRAPASRIETGKAVAEHFSWGRVAQLHVRSYARLRERTPGVATPPMTVFPTPASPTPEGGLTHA
jgi:glycosyltransferase-like protein